MPTNVNLIPDNLSFIGIDSERGAWVSRPPIERYSIGSVLGLPGVASGQPFCFGVMGAVSPPAAGESQLGWAIPRIVLKVRNGKRVLEIQCRDGGPTTVPGSQPWVRDYAWLAREFSDSSPRPACLRMIDLSFPGPLNFIGPDGIKVSNKWRKGIHIDPAYLVSLSGFIKDAFAPLAAASLSSGFTVIIDDEWKGRAADLMLSGEISNVLADQQTLAKDLYFAGISRSEFDGLTKMNVYQGAATRAGQLWANYVHNVLSDDLQMIGTMISDVVGKPVRVISCNHYHRTDFCPVQAQHVYHASPIGAGRTPSGISCVKQYGISGDVWNGKDGNETWGPDDWSRFLCDVRRIQGSVLSSHGPTVALHQWNIKAPQNNQPGWCESDWGRQSLLASMLLTHSPTLWSQRQDDPTDFPAECLARQRMIEQVCRQATSLSGGMGKPIDYLAPVQRTDAQLSLFSVGQRVVSFYAPGVVQPPPPATSIPPADPRDIVIEDLRVQLANMTDAAQKYQADLSAANMDIQAKASAIDVLKSSLQSTNFDLDSAKHMVAQLQAEIAQGEEREKALAAQRDAAIDQRDKMAPVVSAAMTLDASIEGYKQTMAAPTSVPAPAVMPAASPVPLPA